MKPLPAVFAAGVILLSLVGCISRIPPTPDAPSGTIFQRMDANHDGKISRAEFTAGFADAVLTVYNQPATGSIAPEQWSGIERGRTGSFAALDTNHDGKLTRNELAASSPQRDAIVNRIFDRIDKDHDGTISLEEGRPSGLDRTPQQRAEGTGL